MFSFKKFNILFLYSNVVDPVKGGIQSVTCELANYFISKGCSCYYLSLNDTRTNDIKQYYLPNSTSFYNKENKTFLIDFIHNRNIDILINQGGFDKECCRLAFIVKEYGIKLISCIHHPLIDSVRNFDTLYYNRFKRYQLQGLLKISKNYYVKNILYLLYRLKYQKHFKKLYGYSDATILLSESFKKDFSFFVGPLLNKVYIIPNPIPSRIYNSKTDFIKEKIILYVGRIDEHKRVDLLLQIWKLVYGEHNDWTLVIVGGGDKMNSVKKYASELRLENVCFEGFKSPISYYKKASLFCMTSATEAFGIVLIEAMNMKVVPIAFESFSTVRDIIDNNINGVLVKSFDVELYSRKLSELMSNDNMRNNLSDNAFNKSMQYHIDKIGNKWLSLFTTLFQS